MRIFVIWFSLILLIAPSAYCNEESIYEFYGIEAGDTLEYVKYQAEKYGFDIREEPIWTESGYDVALYLSKAERVSLVVVLFKENVHWIDVVEPGLIVNGVTVGTPLSLYVTDQEPLYCYGHRDSSLDELMMRLNNLIALVDRTIANSDLIDQYEATQDVQFLQDVVIKGIWLR